MAQPGSMFEGNSLSFDQQVAQDCAHMDSTENEKDTCK